MTNIKNGAAIGSIIIEDNTNPGLKSAENNLKNFKEEIAKVEDRMRPLQEMMKGGIAIGGLTAGIGALINQSSILSQSLQGVNGNFSNLKESSESAANSLQKIFEILTNNPIVTIATSLAAFCTIGATTISIITQLHKAWKGSVTVLKNLKIAMEEEALAENINNASTIANSSAHVAGTTATASETAASFANASAHVASTTAKVNETTATFAYSTAETASSTATNSTTGALVIYSEAIAKNTFIKFGNATITEKLVEMYALYILTCMKATNATVLFNRVLQCDFLNKNALALKGNTAATIAFSAAEANKTTFTAASTGATILNTNAIGTNTTFLIAGEIATNKASKSITWFTVVTKLLTKTLGVSPLTAWITVISGLVAVVTFAVVNINAMCNSTKKLAELSLKSADAIRKFREALSESNSTDDKKLERLEQLKNKENKTKKDIEEARKLIRELSWEYKGLEISIDGSTISIDKNVKNNIKSQQANRKLHSLEKEYRNLRKALDSNSLKEEEKKETYKKIKQVHVEMDYYRSGGTEDVTGKSEKEILQMKIDKEKSLADEAQRRAEEAQEIADKHFDFINEGRELQKNIEKSMQRENMTALQKEIDAVGDITKSRRDALKLALINKEIKREEYKTEIEALNKLEKLQTKQIVEKYRKEAIQKRQNNQLQANQFYKEQKEKINKERKEKAAKEEEKTLNASIDNNPLEALKTIQEKLTTANSVYDKADTAWKTEVAKATADGFLSEDEKKRIAALEQARAEAMTRVEKMQGFKDTAKGKVQERIDDAVARAKKAQEVNPVATLMRGSVEAYKQEIENANRGKTQNPAVAKIDEVKKQLENEAKEKNELQRRNNAFMEKLCKSVGAV